MGEPDRSRDLRQVDVAAPRHHRARQADAEVGQRGLGDDEDAQAMVATTITGPRALGTHGERGPNLLTPKAFAAIT